MSDEKNKFINRGALWDGKKEKDEPDFVGKLNINGTDYRIMAKHNPKLNRLDPNQNPNIPPILLYHIDHEF